MTVGAPLRASLAVVLALATVTSFGAAFGVMTDCTNEFSCTSTGCAPCATTNTWLTAGWIGQAALLLAGVVMAVLAARRVRLRAVRGAALLLGPVALALFVATTAVAMGSY